jgi:hypothetical protein
VAGRDFDAEGTKQAFEAMDVNKDGKETSFCAIYI